MVPQTYYHVHCSQLKQLLKSRMHSNINFFSAPKSFLVDIKLPLLGGSIHKNWTRTLVATRQPKHSRQQHALTTRQNQQIQ